MCQQSLYMHAYVMLRIAAPYKYGLCMHTCIKHVNTTLYGTMANLYLRALQGSQQGCFNSTVRNYIYKSIQRFKLGT